MHFIAAITHGKTIKLLTESKLGLSLWVALKLCTVLMQQAKAENIAASEQLPASSSPVIKAVDTTDDREQAVETQSPPRSQTLIQQGVTAQNEGRYREAVAIWRLILSENPINSVAHNNLGNALLALGRADEAESAYRSAIAAAPNDALSYYNLGILLAKQNRIEAAIAAYQTLGLNREPIFLAKQSTRIAMEVSFKLPGSVHKQTSRAAKTAPAGSAGSCPQMAHKAS